ncbi:MAG: hypothetical protein H7X80_03800 [bacterium]|nr:hypothetical protein [Candidatus Kapabacteria bacterium]
MNNSDREVASRTRFAGGGSFRVVRTDDDPRSVVPIEDAVVTQGNVAFALRANCDQFVHSLGTVVTQPTWDGPLQLTGAVVDSTDGRDIVRMRITGSTKPAVVRYTMNANGESVDISTPNSIDVPVRFVYTYVGAKVDSTWFSSDRSRLYALSTRMTYNDE